jgi:hypothetical protein
LAQVHWYVRVLPTLATAACGAILVLIFWALGARSPEPLFAGAIVGLLDGALGLLGRHENLPYLRKAETFGAALFAYMKSPWTRARNMIAAGCLVVLGIVIAPRLEQPGVYTVMVLFGSYAAIADLLRAPVLAPWGGSGGLPSNNSLERTREG